MRYVQRRKQWHNQESSSFSHNQREKTAVQVDELEGIMRGLKKLTQDMSDMQKGQQKIDSNLTELRKSLYKLESTIEDGAKETPFERLHTSHIVKDYLAARGFPTGLMENKKEFKDPQREIDPGSDKFEVFWYCENPLIIGEEIVGTAEEENTKLEKFIRIKQKLERDNNVRAFLIVYEVDDDITPNSRHFEKLRKEGIEVYMVAL